MNNEKLQSELERLRQEVNQAGSDDNEVKEKLNKIINDIEIKIEEPENQDHHDVLLHGIKDTISQFESEHPRATAILNDLMVTLSNMGI